MQRNQINLYSNFKAVNCTGVNGAITEALFPRQNIAINDLFYGGVGN